MAVWRAFALFVFALPSLVGAAEPAGTPSPSTWQRLSLTWTHAIAFDGPATSLEAAMRDEGFGDSSLVCDHPSLLGDCSGTISAVSNPYTERLGGPFDTWALRARYQLKPRLGIGLSFCHSPLQTTHGYRADRDGVPYAFPSIDSRATTVAAVFTMGSADLAWAGVGPSLNFVTLEDSPKRPSKATALGAVLEAGFRHPRDSRVFFEAVGQYRYIMPVRMTPPAFDQSHEIGFSHWSLMAGIGIRFGRDLRQP